MGEHIDTRSLRHKKTNESEDTLARKRRVTFKNYIREVEAGLLEDDLEESMNKVEKINFVKSATGCSTIEAEVALDDNNWDIDAAVIEILEDEK